MRYSMLGMLLMTASGLCAQDTGEKQLTLQECYELAGQRNVLVQQARRSVQAREYNLQAEKRSYIPRVDLLAGYNYLGEPLEINLQQVKDGVVNGSSAQSVNTANQVFKQITGRDLPQSVQNTIYNSSRDIINGLYPNYNPALSKQSYFLASLGFRQPIYLGGKLDAAEDLAASQVVSGKINQQVVEKELYFLINAQYLRIMYLNTILRHQAVIVAAFRKNRDYANSLRDNEILPPYLLNWASVAYTQVLTRQRNLELEKQNALLEMNRLTGLPLETPVDIKDTLYYKSIAVSDVSEQPGFWENNPSYRLVESKTDLARVTVKATRSMSLPNIFAIGNVSLYQKDLPVTIPPWLVGVELQWNLFDGFQRSRRHKASRQLVEEAKLAAENTRITLEAGMRVAINKMNALQQEVASLDTARQQSHLTTSMVNERMQNRLSSVKDVNDALLMEEEMQKIYYTAVLGYYLALAEYWNIAGTPQQLAEHLKQ